MLTRLIYTSVAPRPKSVDLADILLTSRARNGREEITGALCFLDGAFMQYLEGEERAVIDLYASIQRDSRHHAPQLLDQSFIAGRIFPGWSMALLAWDERIKAIFYTHAPRQPLDLYRTPPRQAAAVFRALARTPNWLPL